MSKLYYSFYVIPVPKHVLDEINSCVSTFVWCRKSPLIKHNTCIGHFSKGGLSLPNVKYKVYAFRLKLIKKYFDNNCDVLWKHTAKVFFNKYLNMGLCDNIFTIVYSRAGLQVMNPFYAELLSAWDDITCSQRELISEDGLIMQQPLFQNPHVRFEGKLLYFKAFVEAGITTVADICYEVISGFLNSLAIIEIVQNVTHDMPVSQIKAAYAIIVKSLPREWVEYNLSPSHSESCTVKDIVICSDEENIPSSSLSVKRSYSLFVKREFVKPTSVEFWNKFALDINFDKIWKTVFMSDKSSEQIEIDFKICHNIIFTCEKLFKYGIIDTNQCPVCNNAEEDMFHMFVFCDELYETINIFRDIFTNIFRITGFTFNNLVTWLMFGFHSQQNKDMSDIMNILLSIYRTAVFKRRAILNIQNKRINLLSLFKSYVKHHFKLLWICYQKRNNCNQFIRKFVMPLDIISIDNSNNLEFSNL